MTITSTLARAATLLTLAAAAATAQAALLFDGGAPDGLDGRNITNYRTADDFSLAAAASVAGIRFWTIGPASVQPGDITWAVYGSAGGALGALLASGTTAVVPSSIGVPAGGDFETWQIEFPIPALALGAGSYWLELHDGVTLTSEDLTTVGWATTAQVSGSGALQHVLPGLPDTPNVFDRSLAFHLLSRERNEVPAPATPALAGLALLLLGAARRRVTRPAAPR